MMWVAKNYQTVVNNLLRFHDDIDMVHDAIEKVYTKLNTRHKLTPFKFKGYLFITYRNLLYAKKRKAPPETEPADTDTEARHLAERQRREQMMVEVCQWVKDNCNPVDAALFRYYYESGRSYVELSKITGFSKSAIHLKVTNVKMLVREAFGDEYPKKQF